MGPDACDSPEKFGPITATTSGLLATFVATCGAWVALPCVSAWVILIVTGRFPNFPALAWSNAMDAPWNPGTTALAGAPVNAPWNAISTVFFPPPVGPPLEVGLLLLLLHAAATTASTAIAASTLRDSFRFKCPLLS